MNFIGATVTLSIIAAILGGNRRWAALAILLGVCYITQGQELYIGFHFTAIRLALLAGLVRIVVRGELQQVTKSPIDTAVVAYAACLAIIATLRVGATDELVYQIGNLYNITLSYFVFRALLQSKEDIINLVRLATWAIIPLACLLIYEAHTGRNIFSIFGGVSEYSMIRDDHVRAQGAFRSPITAGAFGATFGMLYAGMLFARIERKSALLGLIISTSIVLSARSSGPLLGFFLGLTALACWRYRFHTRKIRWGLGLSLVALHLVMKSPVWFLLGRISDVVGGGGYHRAYLIDNFVKTFGSWWLAGTSDTSSWMATELSFGGADLTNQFVSDGVNAGLLGVVLSIALITKCFRSIGNSIALLPNDPSEQKIFWFLGATLVGSIGILFSVTYFDQMHVIWYLLLATIASATAQAMSSQDSVAPESPAHAAADSTQNPASYAQPR